VPTVPCSVLVFVAGVVVDGSAVDLEAEAGLPFRAESVATVVRVDCDSPSCGLRLVVCLWSSIGSDSTCM